MPNTAPNDHAAQPLPFLWSWGLPILLLISTNFMGDFLPLRAIVVILAGSFFWMGFACVLNANRCRRRHCFYSGPIFFVGAIAVLLVGFGVISIGRDGLIVIVFATLGLALLTYLTEPIFGKYVG